MEFTKFSSVRQHALQVTKHAKHGHILTKHAHGHVCGARCLSRLVSSTLAEPKRQKTKISNKILTAAQRIPGGQHVENVSELIMYHRVLQGGDKVGGSRLGNLLADFAMSPGRRSNKVVTPVWFQSSGTNSDDTCSGSTSARNLYKGQCTLPSLTAE